MKVPVSAGPFEVTVFPKGTLQKEDLGVEGPFVGEQTWAGVGPITHQRSDDVGGDPRSAVPERSEFGRLFPGQFGQEAPSGPVKSAAKGRYPVVCREKL